MWFVCFCYLADQWRKTDIEKLPDRGHGKSGVEAAIAFSFFSIVSFVSLFNFYSIYDSIAGVEIRFPNEGVIWAHVLRNILSVF